jgi:hypothetical protein
MTGPHGGDEAGFVLPAALAASPRDPRRDLPIPPVNLHPDEATGETAVDFTNLNKAVSADLAAERRCSLCGAEMGFWVFLGAPRAAELMRYSDPPGCPDSISTTLMRSIRRPERLSECTVCDWWVEIESASAARRR